MLALSFPKTSTQTHGPGFDAVRHARLWQSRHCSLLAPDWIFSQFGAEAGAQIAGFADALCKTLQRDLDSSETQAELANIGPEQRDAAVAVFAAAFVYHGFAMRDAGTEVIDDATHDMAAAAARCAHELWGDPYPAYQHLGNAAATRLAASGGRDGICCALALVTAYEAPPLSLADTLRDL